MNIKEYSFYLLIVSGLTSTMLQAQDFKDLWKKLEQQQAWANQELDNEDSSPTSNVNLIKSSSTRPSSNTNDIVSYKSFKELEKFLDEYAPNSDNNLQQASSSDQVSSGSQLQDTFALITKKFNETLQQSAALQKLQDKGLSKIQKPQKMPVRQQALTISNNNIATKPLSEEPLTTPTSALSAKQPSKSMVQSSSFQAPPIQQTKKNLTSIDDKSSQATSRDSYKKFVCPECGRRFALLRGLNVHRSRGHKSTSETPESMSTQYL